MKERDIKAEIMIDLSNDNVRLFRFQCGEFQLIDGRWIAVGIPGMSDLMGWTRVTITAEMVGKTVAVFTSLEVKTDVGRLRKKQQSWLNAADAAGCVCGVARSVDNARNIIEEFIDHLSSRS
jgi:hypothetical protein